MKFITPAIAITAFSLLSACATKSNSAPSAVQGVSPGGANSSQIKGSAAYSQTRSIQQAGAASPNKNSSPSRPSPLGTWSGSDNQERVTIKFGSNGSLILTNAAGTNPGKWTASGNGTFRISVGGSDGEFTMIDASTASFTSGGSSIELKRN